MNICSIILSAGKGNRMQSSIPKPLHTISGKTMLQWVIDANIAAKITKYVIVIPKDNKEIEAVTKDLETVVQPIPLGTGDAVIQAKKILKDFNGIIIICFADTPFIAPETLKKLTKAVKNGSKIAINSEILNYLDKIKSNKLTKEIYLTEIVKLAFLNKEKIDFIEINENEILGINNQIELSKAEKISQDFLRNKAMTNGAKLIAPETVFFNFDTKIGKDVVIHPNVIFGKNVNIEKSVEILSFSHIEDSVIKEGSVIGPFARLRGKAIIGPKSKIGNFVEIKNSKLKEQVKINHLSYVGDSEIGKSTNIGAGTITCNYDGKKKNKTKIGSNSFIGSNSSLIAPIKIGDNVTLAAGSVFSKNVPSNSLSIGRAHQVIKKIKTN